MIKGVAFRMFVIYMVMSFFRGRGSTTEDDNSKSQVATVNSGQFANNLFLKGMEMVRNVECDV